MKYAAILLVCAALIGASVSPRVSRNNLAAVERITDGNLVKLDPVVPADALGRTRGVYLEGYGAVFMIELDPIPFAALNPFRPMYKDAEVAKMRSQKETRIAVLKKKMVETMIVMARNLEGVPAREKIALAVTIPYWPWENSTGMPQQILIEAPRSALLQGSSSLESALRKQEF